MDTLKIFDGGSNPELTLAICRALNEEPGRSQNIRFANGEFCPIIEESIRGLDVFVVQTACEPVDSHLVSLLILIDALRRASAERITAVIPNFFYGRQEKKTRGREPISAKLIANLITTAGVDRALVVDLHSASTMGFFDIPVDHLYAIPILARYLQGLNIPDPVVVAPDAGGMNRARALAQILNAPLAILEKERTGTNKVKIHQLIGDVRNKTSILVDDIIDTAGTLTEGIRFLESQGGRDFYACATHALLSGPACDRLRESPIREIIVTDSVPIPPERRLENMKILSLAELMASAIERIHQHESVSTLFAGYPAI